MQESLHQKEETKLEVALKEAKKVKKQNKKIKKKIKSFHYGLIEVRAFSEKTNSKMTNDELDFLVRCADNIIASLELDEKTLTRLIKAIKKLKSMGITTMDSEVMNLLKLVVEKDEMMENYFTEQYRDRYFGFRRVDTKDVITNRTYEYSRQIEESAQKLSLKRN